jgi:hypothetical protein
MSYETKTFNLSFSVNPEYLLRKVSFNIQDKKQQQQQKATT